MIDEWPRDLIDLLVSPRVTEPVAIWIGAGLAAELGYPLIRQLVERLVRECQDAGCGAADVQQARDLLHKTGNYRMATEQCWESLNDPPRFLQVLVEQFSLREEEEKETGVRACENMLKTPFDTYVTTNYNTSLSRVARQLAKQDQAYQVSDVVYPYVDPSKLRERCIHYIHSNVTQADHIILRESAFLEAYADGSPLPEFLGHLFATHNLVFVATDARDDPILWILDRMQRIFQRSVPPVPKKKRYILLPFTEHGPPTIHALQRTYGIEPVWFSVEYQTVDRNDTSSHRIEDWGRLYELLADLREQTEGRWRAEQVPEPTTP